MSQYTRVVTSGNLPPIVPVQFTADDATTAVPAAGNLNVFTNDTTANNDNGIRSTASGSTVTTQLTNRQTGAITTSDATPTTALTFALGATPGVYYIEGNVAAFDVTDTAGGVYNFISGMRTDGATATEIGSEFKDSFEEAAMSASDIAISASANNMIITVTGIAAKTIDWNAFITFRFVS